MREIKYQAWDKLTKQIYDVAYIDFEDHEVGIINFEDRTRSVDDVELREYTGLKDKNGKEIYEGDIVHLHCGGEDGNISKCGIKATIEWERDRFRTRLLGKKYKPVGGAHKGQMVEDYEIHSWVGMHTCLTHGWGYIEIIGNIYENPELLK